MEETKNAAKSIYEISFLIVPTVQEGALASEFGVVKSKIEEIGAQAIAEEFPQLIDLSYEMSKTIANRKTKFTQGYFGWIKFELEPEKIAQVKTFVDASDKIIRSLIITTVRENTVSGKKFAPKVERKKFTAKRDETSAEPVNVEELDKQIDDLVTEAAA